MPNRQIVFADRLVGISIQNGLVRIDYAVNAGTAKDKDGKTAQRMEVTTQLVLPFEAFANGVGMQQKLMKELAERAQKQLAESKASADNAAPKS